MKAGGCQRAKERDVSVSQRLEAMEARGETEMLSCTDG